MKALLLLLIAAAISCGRADAPVAAADPKPPPIPYGRWTSETHCLTLFENGDFELVDMRHATHGKTMVMGAAQQIPHDDGYHFDLAVARIWQARWVSSCRKDVKFGGMLKEFETAGVTWKPGLHQKVRIAANDGGAELDVCIDKECLTLKKATPVVAAEWRSPDFMKPAAGSDVPVVLVVDPSTTSAMSSLETPAPTQAAQRPTAYGTTAKLDVLGPDRFRWTFLPSLLPDDNKVTIFGAPIASGTPITLELHRLAGERLEACLAKRCATFERAFDGDHYDLD